MNDRQLQIPWLKKNISIFLLLAFFNLSLFPTALPDRKDNPENKRNHRVGVMDQGSSFIEVEADPIKSNSISRQKSILPYVLIGLGVAAATVVVILLLVKKKVSNNASSPVADFTFNTSGLQATFINLSSNSSSYSWNFGDGSSSTKFSPSHVYSSSGTYSVTLTAFEKGNADSITKSVTVSASGGVMADFSWSASGLSVSFTNLSSNASSYSWNFGDGSTSTLTNATHIYANAGTYSVSLTAYGNGSSHTKTKSVSVSSGGTTTNITFNNPVFTDMYITISGVTKTAAPGGSVTFYNVSGSSATYHAETYGQTTSGTQVGLKIIWDNTISLSGGSKNMTLVITSEYFFLYIKNSGNHNLSPIYVNYGLQSQTQDNVVVPTGGQQIRLGYYKAFSNGNVRAYYQDNPSTYVYWNQGQHYNLPFTDNQSVILTNSITNSFRVDEKLKGHFTLDPSGAQGLIVENSIRGRVEPGKDAIVHYGKAEK